MVVDCRRAEGVVASRMDCERDEVDGGDGEDEDGGGADVDDAEVGDVDEYDSEEHGGSWECMDDALGASSAADDVILVVLSSPRASQASSLCFQSCSSSLSSPSSSHERSVQYSASCVLSHSQST